MVPCSVVELRQYTLRPGRRSALVELFDRHFVDGQESAGIQVLGQFEDVDHPDRFIWFRGFPDMASRRVALSAFYDGPVWRTYRDAANATMIDSDDVLLLRPVPRGRSFPRRTGPVNGGRSESRVLVRIFHRAPGATDLVFFFREQVRPTFEATGPSTLVELETKRALNDYPRLPIRETADVLVSMSLFPDERALRLHLALLAADLHWTEHVAPALRSRLTADPEQRILRPTPRSSLQ
jgi:NIPSNAP